MGIAPLLNTNLRKKLEPYSRESLDQLGQAKRAK